MKIIEVTWLDANHQFGPISECEVTQGNPVKLTGYLVCRDDNFISIAMEHWPDIDTYRNVTTIPIPLVKKISIIRK